MLRLYILYAFFLITKLRMYHQMNVSSLYITRCSMNTWEERNILIVTPFCYLFICKNHTFLDKHMGIISCSFLNWRWDNLLPFISSIFTRKMKIHFREIEKNFSFFLRRFERILYNSYERRIASSIFCGFSIISEDCFWSFLMLYSEHQYLHKLTCTYFQLFIQRPLYS